MGDRIYADVDLSSCYTDLTFHFPYDPEFTLRLIRGGDALRQIIRLSAELGKLCACCSLLVPSDTLKEDTGYVRFFICWETPERLVLSVGEVALRSALKIANARYLGHTPWGESFRLGEGSGTYYVMDHHIVLREVDGVLSDGSHCSLKLKLLPILTTRGDWDWEYESFEKAVCYTDLLTSGRIKGALEVIFDESTNWIGIRVTLSHSASSTLPIPYPSPYLIKQALMKLEDLMEEL